MADEPIARDDAQDGDEPIAPPTPQSSVAADSAPSETADENAPWRRTTIRGTPHSVTDRLTIYVARAVFFLVAVGLGVNAVGVLRGLDVTIGVYTGVLVASVLAILLIVIEALFARSPIRTIAAVTFGLLMGLVVSLVFQPVIALIVEAVVPPSVGEPELTDSQLGALRAFLNLMTTSIFCFFGVALLVGTKDEFKFIVPFVEFRKEIKSHIPLVLDTSVFIDGRMRPLLEAGVFDQRLEVPRFVLDELQRVADSADRSLRERGRRGLDILHEIERRYHVDIVDFPLGTDEEVDAALLRLTVVHEGKLVTTDHNLCKRARVQGAPAININDVAAALKPAYVPGESLRVRLQREGEDPGQAVGFLEDGTMVVVEGARDNLGREVSVEVTSSLQTNAGKMLFGRLARAGKGRRRGKGRAGDEQ